VDSNANALVEDLFRREFGRLVSALTRLLGPAHVSLAEDVVQEALMTAMDAWRFESPRDPKAWILQVAKRRAIDVIRREKRLEPLPAALESEWTIGSAFDDVLSEQTDTANQLAMMFAICDGTLSVETHVTLILRFLCGFSPAEIARAFLVDTATIDRRLHRGRNKLRELNVLPHFAEFEGVERQRSVLHALYLLFNEGYQGSNPENPLLPGLCDDALRLVELLGGSPHSTTEVHALAALFCFGLARMPARLDRDGIFVPLREQDRSVWDARLIQKGVLYLSKASAGEQLTRWHLEAGIACEHTVAPSFEATNWRRIIELYDLLLVAAPNPVIAINRAIAVAENGELGAAHAAMLAFVDDKRVASYPFFWAALAHIESRAALNSEAVEHFQRAIRVARNQSERSSIARQLQRMTH
jgi:RNA polymerase sigma factor (sigma-70 family)